MRPHITADTKARVCDVLDSGYLTEGPVTHEFEAACASFLGCKHALAVCNCTVGLEMALRSLGVGPDDEVIVPDYTYPATASVVALVGATVVLVDVNPATMLIDYDALAEAITPRTRVVMPVSLFGNPLDYKRLNELKVEHGFDIVEDAACSVGAVYAGKRVGTHADISVFSMHPRKFITTGEGGLVTTARADLAEWMESYKHFGMASAMAREGTAFVRIGTNYKLSNVLAAIGLSQMDEIEQLLSRRRELAERYREGLADVPGIKLPTVTEGGQHSWQSCCVLVEDRDRVMAELRERGIEVQIGTYALHMHPAYQPGDTCRHVGPLDGSRASYERCLTLPLYHDLTADDQDRVIFELRDALKS